MIQPYLTYCASVWMAWVANYARSYKNYRIGLSVPSPVLLMIFTSLLEELNWNKLAINRRKQKVILMHNTINKRTSQYFQEMVAFKENAYRLRDFDNKLIIPQPRTE